MYEFFTKNCASPCTQQNYTCIQYSIHSIPPSDPTSQTSTTPGSNESQNTQIPSSCGGQDDESSNSSSSSSSSSENDQDEADVRTPIVENGSTSNGNAATPHDVQLGYALE